MKKLLSWETCMDIWSNLLKCTYVTFYAFQQDFCFLQEVDSMKLEIETLQKEVQSYEEQLVAVADSIASINNALADLTKELAESQVMWDDSLPSCVVIGPGFQTKE